MIQAVQKEMTDPDTVETVSLENETIRLGNVKDKPEKKINFG